MIGRYFCKEQSSMHMKGSVFWWKKIRWIRETFFQPNQVLAHHSSPPHPPFLERQSLVHLRVSSVDFANDCFTWDQTSLSVTGFWGRDGYFHPRDPVDVRAAHILHLMLASFAMNRIGSLLLLSKTKAIKKCFLDLRQSPLMG